MRAAMESGALHHAWLLAGPEGVGKASFARRAATLMLAQAAGEARASGDDSAQRNLPTARLMAAGSHPDFRELRRLPKDPDKSEELARSISVAQVRELIGRMTTKPTLSARRVVLVDSVDELEGAGAPNALLKSLEEPPAGTIFLLVSHSPGRLLPTIRSRCRLLRFGLLSTRDTETVISQVLPDADAEERAALVRASEGAPGRGLHYAGLDVAAIDRALSRIAEEGDPTNGDRLTLGRALSGKSAQARYEIFLDRAPTLIATIARGREGEALRHALDAYAAARDLASAALRLTLDPAATVFEMSGIVARLALDGEPG